MNFHIDEIKNEDHNGDYIIVCGNGKGYHRYVTLKKYLLETVEDIKADEWTVKYIIKI